MDEPAAKKPKPTPTAVIGPSNTGTGAEIGTQLFVCVEHLTSIYPNSIRREDMAMRDGFNVLYNEELFARLIKHHSVKWDPKLELLRYKPEYDLQSADDVVAELRRWLPRGGMPVATIKKSWPNCMPALEELERSKRIYVIRTEGSTERSGQPKTIFLNQTGKTQPIDEAFKRPLIDGKTPDDPELIKELEEAGLTPANAVALPATLPSKAKKKGAGKGRRVKVANQHIDGVDFSRDYKPAPQ